MFLEGSNDPTNRQISKGNRGTQDAQSKRYTMYVEVFKMDERGAHKDSKKLGNAAAAENRRTTRQNELREKLKCEAYLINIEKISNELSKLSALLKRRAKPKSEEKLSTLEISAHKVRILALKTQVDIEFRRLAKVLPDLKAIEILDEDGNNPLSGLIAAIMRTQK